MAYTGVGTDPGASPTLLVFADVVSGDNIQGVKLIDATAGSSTPVGTSGNPLWTQSSASGTSTLYHVVAAASNNAANIKNAAGVLVNAHCYNNTTHPIFVKFYNKASTPNPAADTVVAVLGVQAGTWGELKCGPATFTTGISVAMVTGISDTDNTALALNDATLTVEYI